MSWVAALIKALLDWFTAEVKKDTKASDADGTPRHLRDKWKQRIKEQEEKVKNEKDNDSSE
tara:strand:+ start:578 stop:760 length:183 start_codon:yes stop_codon:yes gene_type:complete